MLRLQYSSLLSESRNSILTLLFKKDEELSASNYSHSVQLEICTIIRTSREPFMAIGAYKKMCWCWEKSLFFSDYCHFAKAFLSSWSSLVLCSCSDMAGNSGAMASDLTHQKASTDLPKRWIVMEFVRSSEHKKGRLVEKDGRIISMQVSYSASCLEDNQLNECVILLSLFLAG